MLTNRIQVVEEEISNDPVDIFEQSLFTIFSDSRNQHGEPGLHVIYKSSKFGDLKLRLANPDPSENRLFSHFLWNASLQAAEMITDGEFDINKQTVLELGAGAALPGILCCLSGADETVLSDYPAKAVLDNVHHNIEENIPELLRTRVSVVGHEWGTLQDDLCKNWKNRFTRIIAADCMWMDWEHENLCKSIVQLMSSDGICLAIAGFHTGRAKVAAFFEATERAGLIPLKPIFERDIEGKERPWKTDRGIEDPVERKRWLTIAFLGLSSLT
ncbi:hypothetical protein EDC01DRAFT_415217 [Geopyxis carbonaria]|nr:hypothetical protein EDC01DRAFT_415217 [Geopyxis carbonaria]